MSEPLPFCQIIPLPNHQVSVHIDQTERLRWHFGPHYPRPFFFPFNGPSGESLTRMGHPGAENHDHHRSVWFAHEKVEGVNFWSDGESRIRQLHWLVYEDGDEQAILATRLGWFDGHDAAPLLEQTLIVIVKPADRGETLVELQSAFRPTAESLEFQPTNFGFLAVRVARSLSEHFGGGRLTNSEGLVGEKDSDGKPNIFGKPARWMDYSGPVSADRTEGITYFDHPQNPSYPSIWHVREDGWMGACACRPNALTTTRRDPLFLRFLLHAHGGAVDPRQANRIAAVFAKSARYEVVKSTQPHRQFEVREKS